MKVCIIGSSKKFYSGISAYTVAMANSFAQQGYEVSVVLIRNLVPLFLYPGKEHVGKTNNSLDFSPGIHVFEGMDWNSPRSWVGAKRFLEQQKPDAIIMHWWTSAVAHMQLYLAYIARLGKHKIPLILEMHEVVDPLEERIAPIRLYSRAVGKLLINLSHSITAHSNDVMMQIKKTYSVNGDKMHVVPHGPYNLYGYFDQQEAKKELTLDGFTVLCFGMIRKYKGVALLVRAFNQLPPGIAQNMHLVIAGEDWGDEPDLVPAINHSPYADRIKTQFSFIPDEMVPKYFAAADVVVLPYLRTCGSGVLNIAIAQGKPVMASGLPTMQENLINYSGAVFFPVGDINALSLALIKEYEEWQQGKGKTYIYDGATWDEISKKYKEIITGLMQENIQI